MNIGLSIVADTNACRKLSSIQYVNILLKDFFKDKDYNVINHYWIVCQILKMTPGFEHFWRVPRQRFDVHRHIRNRDNSFSDYYGVYSCGFNIVDEEYDAFVAATDEEAKRIIARKVVESLSNLDRLSKKAAGFDKERFKADIIRLFQEHDLL